MTKRSVTVLPSERSLLGKSKLVLTDKQRYTIDENGYSHTIQKMLKNFYI